MKNEHPIEPTVAAKQRQQQQKMMMMTKRMSVEIEGVAVGRMLTDDDDDASLNGPWD
jgi:hypothetical protein